MPLEKGRDAGPVDGRLGMEREHDPAFGPVDPPDAQPPGQVLERAVAQEVLDGLRQGPVPVLDLVASLVDLPQVFNRSQPLVEVEPEIDLRQIVLGDPDVDLEVDLRVLLLHGLALELADGLVEQLHVVFEPDGLHGAVLLVPEEVPGPPDLQVLGGQTEARAELAELLEGLEPLSGQGRQLHMGRDQEIGVGLTGRPPDPPPELVELGQPAEVGPVHDEGVDERDVDAVLDDGRRDQDVELVGDEVQHLLLEGRTGQPAVDGDHPGLRDEPGDELGDRVYILDPVVDEVGLAAPAELLPHGRGDEPGVERGDDRVNGQAVARRGLDEADVPQPRKRHVERPRDGGRRQRQDVDRRLELLDPLFVPDAEALLFVDDEQPEVLEGDVPGEQAVRADDDVDEPLPDGLDEGFSLPRGLEPRQGLDADREEHHPVAEGLEVLAGQDGRGAEDGDLLAVHDGLEGGPHGHLGLPVPDVPAEEPVHRGFRFHARPDLPDGPELVLGLLEFEDLLELPLPVPARREGESPEGPPLGVELDELPGHGLDGLPGPGLGLVPGVRAQLVQGGGLGAGPGEFLDEVQVLDRHEQLVAFPVVELDELAPAAVDLESLEAPEDADAVVGVDDVVAGAQVLELGEERPPGGPADKDLFLREHVLLREEIELFLRVGEAAGQGAEKESDLGTGGNVQGRIGLENGDLALPQ